MSMQAALQQIEAKMAELKGRIDAGNAAAAPVRAELDELLAEQQALQARIDAKVAELNEARGDGQSWLDLKRQYGTLAATRMQMRAAMKAM